MTTQKQDQRLEVLISRLRIELAQEINPLKAIYPYFLAKGDRCSPPGSWGIPNRLSGVVNNCDYVENRLGHIVKDAGRKVTVYYPDSRIQEGGLCLDADYRNHEGEIKLTHFTFYKIEDLFERFSGESATLGDNIRAEILREIIGGSK